MDINEFAVMAQALSTAAEQLRKVQGDIAEVVKQNAAIMSGAERSRNYLCLPDFLNMKELCAWFNISYSSMKPLVDLPDFPKIPIGTSRSEFRFPKEAVKEWVSHNMNSDKRVKKAAEILSEEW